MKNNNNNNYNNNNRPANNKIPFLGKLRPIEMIGIGLLLLAMILYGLSKCSGDKKSNSNNSKDLTENNGQNPLDAKSDALRRSLYVCQDSLRMRRAPHKDSAVVKLLNYGEEIIDMGEYENEQTIKVTPETSATEPWIKVKTKDGRLGWVFGAYIRPYPKKRQLPEEKEKIKEKSEEKPKSDNKEKNSNSKNTTKKSDTKDK